jgi:pSer/pThr/pTyr-binding forkhead associated (FHA) protein
MAKIILSTGNTVLREVVLAKERITIGRAPHNDIVIDNGAISAEHAVIVTIDDDSFLEDLNSTNGTQVNGQPVKKHFFQNGDVVELAQFQLRYLSGNDDQSYDSRFFTPLGAPVIEILNGSDTGKMIVLTKALTTIGRPGLQVVVITRRGQNYYITHVEGSTCPIVNGSPIDSNFHLMVQGDSIDLAGTQMRFSFASSIALELSNEKLCCK